MRPLEERPVSSRSTSTRVGTALAFAVVAWAAALGCEPHTAKTQPPLTSDAEKAPLGTTTASTGEAVVVPTATHWVDQIGGSGMEQPDAFFVERDGSTVVLGHADECTQFGVVGDREICPPPAATPGTPAEPLTFLARWDASGRLIDAVSMNALDVSIRDVVPRDDGGMVVAGLDASNELTLVWLERGGKEQRRARVGNGARVLNVRLESTPQGGLVLGGTLMGGRLDDAHVHVEKNGMEVFVSGLARDGRPQWTSMLGGGNRRWSPDDNLDALAVARDGTIWATGGCRADKLEELPARRGPSLACGDLDISDVFFGRWTADGKLVELQALSGQMIRVKPGKTWHENQGVQAPSIVATPDGGALWTVSFDSDARFGRGDRRVRVATRGDHDVILGRFSADGALAWWQHIGGPHSDWTEGLAIDRDENAWVFAVGQGMQLVRDAPPANVPARAQAQPRDAVIVAYDRAGELARHDTATQPASAGGPTELRAAGLVVAEAGVRALLWFAGTVRLPVGDREVTLRGRGGRNVPDDLAVWALAPQITAKR